MSASIGCSWPFGSRLGQIAAKAGRGTRRGSSKGWQGSAVAPAVEATVLVRRTSGKQGGQVSERATRGNFAQRSYQIAAVSRNWMLEHGRLEHDAVEAVEVSEAKLKYP